MESTRVKNGYGLCTSTLSASVVGRFDASSEKRLGAMSTAFFSSSMAVSERCRTHAAHAYVRTVLVAKAVIPESIAERRLPWVQKRDKKLPTTSESLPCARPSPRREAQERRADWAKPSSHERTPHTAFVCGNPAPFDTPRMSHVVRLLCFLKTMQEGEQSSLGPPLQRGRIVPDAQAAGDAPGAKGSSYAEVLPGDSDPPEQQGQRQQH